SSPEQAPRRRSRRGRKNFEVSGTSRSRSADETTTPHQNRRGRRRLPVCSLQTRGPYPWSRANHRIQGGWYSKLPVTPGKPLRVERSITRHATADRYACAPSPSRARSDGIAAHAAETLAGGATPVPLRRTAGRGA